MIYRFSTNIISYIILTLGYIEAVIGLLQWLGISASHHPDYAFTGSFFNPGPYACFLSITVPTAIYVADYGSNKIARWAAGGYMLICAVMIPATLSRTAIAACAVGSTVAMMASLRHHLIKAPKIWIIAVALCLILGISSLYMVKQDSADGRFLMWKVEMEATKEVPLTGVGWDNVAGTYGEAQERYFASGRASEQERMVADAPEFVFNEYLRIWIAFGPIAALAMTAAIMGGIITAYRARQYGLAGSATAIAAVMTASYPLEFPIFVAAIALVLVGCYICARPIWARITGTTIVAGGCALFLTHNHKTNVDTVFQVAHTLHRQRDYQKSNAYLMDLKEHSSDPMILNIIGKNYQALGIPDSAVYYLRKSIMRCPNRMYPHYLLMNLYNDSISLDIDACRREAEIILRMKVKISSEATEEMRQQANEVIVKKSDR